MAKITQITIVDENTLRLEVDAHIGDEIDLNALKEFDTSSLRKRIEEGKEKEYLVQLKREQEKFDLKLSSALIEQASKLKNDYEQAVKEKEIEILKIQTEKEQLSKTIDDKAQVKANDEVKKYIEQIKLLENDKLRAEQNHQIELLNLKKELELLKSSIDSKVQLVENQKQIDLNTKEQEYKDTIYKLELKYTTSLMEKDNEILRIMNDRTSLNVKKIGEDLERWCNNEYESYANTGFITSTWEKDNVSIKEEGESKGTKADYIFKVFDNANHDQLITSVACEMKSEDIVSNSKKKNSDHYAKLEKDRIKKNCEYSLLISELEWDQANDIPIKRVRDYHNMYVVRPQYFITFLTVIESLAKKYQELVLANKLQEIKFENSINILEKFEEFKNDLIDVSLKKLSNALDEIKKQARNINKAADLILAESNKIVDHHIESIKNKIDKFSIKKLAKSVDALDE